MAEQFDVTMYPEVLGSMTSDDGNVLFFHVRDIDGADRMIGFPHCQIPQLIEMAAVQAPAGAGLRKDQDVAAFHTSSFSLGLGAAGQLVLSLTIGENGKVNFLLLGTIPTQLSESLRRASEKAAGQKSSNHLN